MKKQKKSKAIHLKITPVVSLGLLSLSSCSSFDDNRLHCIDISQGNRIVSKDFCKKIEESVDQKIKECNKRFVRDNEIEACEKNVENEARNMNHPFRWYYLERSTQDMMADSSGNYGGFMYFYNQGYIRNPQVQTGMMPDQSHFGKMSDVGKPHSSISRSGFIGKSGGYVTVSRGGFGSRSGSFSS